MFTTRAYYGLVGSTRERKQATTISRHPVIQGPPQCIPSLRKIVIVMYYHFTKDSRVSPVLSSYSISNDWSSYTIEVLGDSLCQEGARLEPHIIVV